MSLFYLNLLTNKYVGKGTQPAGMVSMQNKKAAQKCYTYVR